MAASSATPPTSIARTSSRCSARCVARNVDSARRAPEELAHLAEAFVRNGDRKDVLLDQPAALAQRKDAAAPRRTEVLRLQLLVEPSYIAADGHVAMDAAERPRLSAREVRMRVCAKS